MGKLFGASHRTCGGQFFCICFTLPHLSHVFSLFRTYFTLLLKHGEALWSLPSNSWWASPGGHTSSTPGPTQPLSWLPRGSLTPVNPCNELRFSYLEAVALFAGQSLRSEINFSLFLSLSLAALESGSPTSDDFLVFGC
ncbi:unnamed protein product [Prunus armeniaca]